MFRKVVNAIEIVAVIAAVGFVVMLFVAKPGAGSSATTQSGAYLSETGAAPTTGAEIYAAHCATCHGADGQGGVGPRLAGRVADRFPVVDDQVAVVTKGRETMPSFGGTLSGDDITAVVEYTRTALGN